MTSLQTNSRWNMNTIDGYKSGNRGWEDEQEVALEVYTRNVQRRTEIKTNDKDIG